MKRGGYASTKCEVGLIIDEKKEKNHLKPISLHIISTSRRIIRCCRTNFWFSLLICLSIIVTILWIIGNFVTTQNIIYSSGKNPLNRQYFPRTLHLDANDLSHVAAVLPQNPFWKSDDQRSLEYPLTAKDIRELKPLNPMLTRDTCTILADWQLSYHPSCNSVHEVDLLKGRGVKHVNHGAYRDVWRIPDFDGTFRVIKTLLYSEKRNFDLRNFDRHRRDAISFEQLASSPFVVNIYGHCSNSALFDFCDGGDLYNIFQSEPTTMELLQVAFEVAASVADSHHFDSNGRPTIAHTDIKPNQWILGSDGHYRLNDFNRARFLGWDQQKNVTCPFYVGKNIGIWRAPEEYKYEEQTNKCDVWSLGNVLYYLITRKRPYKNDKAIELIKRGHPPKIKDDDMFRGNMHSSESAMRHAMRKAMKMCFVADPIKRPEAKEIAKMLKQVLEKYIR